MVKIYLIRHAESELNVLKQKTADSFGLKSDEYRLFLGYKFVNKPEVVDADLTEVGKLQCKVANLQNKEKFKKVVFLEKFRILFSKSF